MALDFASAGYLRGGKKEVKNQLVVVKGGKKEGTTGATVGAETTVVTALYDEQSGETSFDTTNLSPGHSHDHDHTATAAVRRCNWRRASPSAFPWRAAQSTALTTRCATWKRRG